MPDNTTSFRQQLADTLRRKDTQALTEFLLASGQWTPETVPADVEAMMWVMILGNSALGDLHHEAEAWLTAHGRASDVAVLRQRGGAPKRNAGGEKSGSEKHRPTRR